MSEFTDNLFAIDSDTPDDMRPVIRPQLAGLLWDSEAIDRAHAKACNDLRDEHKAATEPILEEIDDLKFQIELQEIRGALGRRCVIEGLDPSLFVHRLQPRCEMCNGELLILGLDGELVTFADAVAELGEDDE